MFSEIMEEIDVIDKCSDRIRSSNLISFLAEFFSEELSFHEAVELEMALNSCLDRNIIDEIRKQLVFQRNADGSPSYTLSKKSRPDQEKFEAVTRDLDLLKDFINTKLDSPTLIAIKFYTDIFEPEATDNPKTYMQEQAAKYQADSNYVNTPKKLKEKLLEIGTKDPHYFIEKYTQTISSSEIQAPENVRKNHHQIIHRKRAFITKNLPRAMNHWIDQVDYLLRSTPINSDYAILKIIDLHYKNNPNTSAKQHIDEAVKEWKMTLKWDTENLEKHSTKSKVFFQIANVIIKNSLIYKSRSLPEINSLADLTYGLDLHSSHRYNATKRKSVISAIEKAWKEHEKHNSCNQKKSIPSKKTCLWISKICYQTLESKEFGETQPDSIKHVMERFNASKPTPAKTKSAPPRFPLDKSKVKQLGVVLDSGTKKIIAALAKKLGMYNYQILEAAVEYCLTQQAPNSTQRQPVNSVHSFPELDKRIAHPKNTNKALETSEHPTTDIKCDMSLNSAELPSEQPISPLPTAQEPTQEPERSNHPKTAKKNKRKARKNSSSSSRRGKGRKR